MINLWAVAGCKVMQTRHSDTHDMYDPAVE